MNAGRKNRLIEIYKPSTALDGANEAEGWAFVKSKAAEIKGETGMAGIRGAAQNGGVITPSNRYSFRVNYDPCINEKMQVRLNGTCFGVIKVTHDLAMRRFTDIICEQGGSNG